ncbi:hypothetical protein WR25_09915 [Diploscapter pachys]|uniref:Uncharacterized protein n=1 Tax=Diploscapter pachys TaxID=2018661 RepID=A0A2A2JYT7_9BILA|nr:hypothetical protein WR25_09915 [Diploscapter pachys]
MSNKMLFGILLQSLILAYSSAAPTQPCSSGDIILERITDRGGKAIKARCDDSNECNLLPECNLVPKLEKPCCCSKDKGCTQMAMMPKLKMMRRFARDTTSKPVIEPSPPAPPPASSSTQTPAATTTDTTSVTTPTSSKPKDAGSQSSTEAPKPIPPSVPKSKSTESAEKSEEKKDSPKTTETAKSEETKPQAPAPSTEVETTTTAKLVITTRSMPITARIPLNAPEREEPAKVETTTKSPAKSTGKPKSVESTTQKIDTTSIEAAAEELASTVKNLEDTETTTVMLTSEQTSTVSKITRRKNLFAGDPSDDNDDSADADSSFFRNSKNGVTDLTTQVAMSSGAREMREWLPWYVAVAAGFVTSVVLAWLIVYTVRRKNRNRAAREARARSQADSKKSSEEPDISAASSPLIASSNTDGHKP